MFQNKIELTREEMMTVLSGKDRWSITSSEDHPDFTLLREHLGAEGYISIQRGWWNGDRVLKPFFLNGFKFKTGEQFPCAAAMRGVMAVRQMRAARRRKKSVTVCNKALTAK